jgi:hypothetical protein
MNKDLGQPHPPYMRLPEYSAALIVLFVVIAATALKHQNGVVVRTAPELFVTPVVYTVEITTKLTYPTMFCPWC